MTAFTPSCMSDGPSFLVGGNEEPTSCGRHKGHTLQHEWWNDDGSIRLTWWDDFVFGEGRWRDGWADEE